MHVSKIRLVVSVLASVVLAVACDSGGSGEGGDTAAPATTASGLEITHLVVGEGPSPAPTDRVEVHYHGTFDDGSVFDSSVDRGTPAVFPLNRVIPCWTEGLQLMKVGGKAKLVCPPGIAYGARGAPPRIPGNATLTFEVELLSIK
jgi:FKBP-type peptidyl-prolyl cis-trans isomerase FkpA